MRRDAGGVRREAEVAGLGPSGLRSCLVVLAVVAVLGALAIVAVFVFLFVLLDGWR